MNALQALEAQITLIYDKVTCKIVNIITDANGEAIRTVQDNEGNDIDCITAVLQPIESKTGNRTIDTITSVTYTFFAQRESKQIFDLLKGILDLHATSTEDGIKDICDPKNPITITNVTLGTCTVNSGFHMLKKGSKDEFLINIATKTKAIANHFPISGIGNAFIPEQEARRIIERKIRAGHFVEGYTMDADGSVFDAEGTKIGEVDSQPIPKVVGTK